MMSLPSIWVYFSMNVSIFCSSFSGLGSAMATVISLFVGGTRGRAGGSRQTGSGVDDLVRTAGIGAVVVVNDLFDRCDTGFDRLHRVADLADHGHQRRVVAGRQLSRFAQDAE